MNRIILQAKQLQFSESSNAEAYATASTVYEARTPFGTYVYYRDGEEIVAHINAGYESEEIGRHPHALDAQRSCNDDFAARVRQCLMY